MKQFVRSAALSLILASIYFTACPEGGTEIIDNADALVNTVWAGETPREDDWLTISFLPEGKVIWSFTIDNTTNEWEYTFNTVNTGTITTGIPWNPAPNGFTVNGDILTVTNYGNHAGAPRDFRRVRHTDVTPVTPVPFTPGDLAADLSGSVWAGNTPRDGDWLTITFNPDGKVIWSFTYDNSTNEWNYTWDGTGGSIDTAIPWNPAPEGFTINGDTLTIANYGGHGGASRAFQRYR